MKVLVTGGAGFIGSALVRELEARGAQVVVLDALTYAGNPRNLEGTRSSLVTADIRDKASVRLALLEHRPDAVAHLAADSHVQRSYRQIQGFLDVNVLGTETLLEAAMEAGVGRFLHVSTDEVFGDVLDGWAVESTAPRPRNPYAASKAAAEMVVEAYRATFGYPVVMVRLSNCYGQRQHVEKLVPLTISRLLSGEPAILHGDGRQVRDWLHVEDAARGIADALERGRPAATYNLPGGYERSVRDVVQDLVQAVVGDGALEGWIKSGPDRIGRSDRRYGMRGDLAREELNWTPIVRYHQAITQTAAWYKARPKRLERRAVEKLEAAA